LRSRTLNDARPCLRNQVLARLLIQGFEGEILLRTQAVHERLHTGDQTKAIAGTADFGAHPPAHFADQTIREISASGFTELRKKLSAITRNDQQQTLARIAWPADFQIVGNAQRIIVELFIANALHRRHDKVDARPLPQIFKNYFQPLTGRRVKHFREVVDVSSRLWQTFALSTGVPICGQAAQNNDDQQNGENARPPVNKR
jgi:hypothetical protein